MIIDAHIHLVRDGYRPDSRAEYLARRAAYRRPPFSDPEKLVWEINDNLNDADGSRTIAAMDKAGVKAAVIMALDSSIAMKEEPRIPVAEMHRQYGELQKRYPGRLYAFAGPDPRRPDAIEIFERAIKEHGLKGLKIYPPSGYYPTDPILRPFYERCLEWDIPVVSHTAAGGFPNGSTHAPPRYLSDVQAEYPDLKIWLAHAGYPRWFDEALEVASSHLNTYVELSQWNRWLANDEAGIIEKIARARDTIGAHRILFASDFNSPGSAEPANLFGFSYTAWVDLFRNLPEKASKYGYRFAREEVDLMVRGNVARLLKLEKVPDLEVPEYAPLHKWRVRDA